MCPHLMIRARLAAMSRVRFLAFAGVILLGSLGSSGFGVGVAHAQDQASPDGLPSAADPAGNPENPVDLEKARGHYRNAEAAMASGEYARAATEYQAAFDASKDPVLHYKIGDAHERAGDCQKAIDSYRAYLAQGTPDEQFKATTEQRMARCSAILANQGTAGATGDAANTEAGGTTASNPTASNPGVPDPTAGAAGDPGTSNDPTAGPTAGLTGGSDGAAGAGSGDVSPTFADSRTSWQRDAGWIAVGVAVALVSTGGVLAVSANSREEDLQNLIDFRDILTGEPQDFSGNTQARYEELREEGKDLDTYSTIAFVAAGAAVASAVTFFILDATSGNSGGGPEIISSSRSGVRIVPRVGSPKDGIGATASWRF